MAAARHAARGCTAVASSLSALLALAGSLAAQSMPQVRDLRQLEAAAERRSPALRAAHHAVLAAEAKLDEATISPFFQFTARGATGIAPDARGVPGFTQDSQVLTDQAFGPFVSGSVQGAIPLYTFGKISAARDAAEAGVTGAALGTRRARAQLRFDVRRAYFALQLALDTLQMISEGNSKLDKAARRLQERIDEGDPDVDDFDMYRLQAAIAEVAARTAEAHNLEAAARAGLHVLSGMNGFEIPDCPIAMIDFELQAVERYADQARGNRPELGMLDAANEARRADVRAQRAGYFPDLALALQAGQTVTPGRTDQVDGWVPDPANFTTLGAALVAEWKLDLWGNSTRVRGAESRLALGEAQTQLARDGIDMEIATAHAALIEVRERELAWRRGHEQTRRWFIAAAQGYEVGTREPKDLIDALKAYFTARFSHLQATHDHNVGVAKLEQVVGSSVIEANAWYQACDAATDAEDDSGAESTSPPPPSANTSSGAP